MPIQSIQPALTTPEEQETLDVFLQRAQAAGLDPEEITSEVQSRYDIDLSGPMKAVQDLQETMGAAFTGGGTPWNEGEDLFRGSLGTFCYCRRNS